MQTEQEFQLENSLDLFEGDLWSNAACCGYLLLACKMGGVSTQNSRLLLEALEAAFGNYTVQQAEKEYYKPMASTNPTIL